MLEIVTFKWRPFAGYRSSYGPAQVNILRNMLARHYPKPHRLTCITDDPSGIDSDIRTIPLWNDFADLPSPHGGKNPSCYRRLKLFAPEMRELIGERFVAIDLDMLIVGDLSSIFDRSEDFVMYGDNTNPRTFYNGSLMLMTAGARRQVWDSFDPKESPLRSMQRGHFGSDQGWISYCLGKGEATWTKKDGIWSYRCHLAQWPKYRDRLPPNAKIVVFHGRYDPWDSQMQGLSWVTANYR